MIVAMIAATPEPNTSLSYASNSDGGAPVAVRMCVAGSLGPGYAAFVADRASWLSLSGWIEQASDELAFVVAVGPEALVGALEMACLLGPNDTLVRTLDRHDDMQFVPQGFAVRG